MGAAKTKGKGGCERDLYKHSGCSTTSVQVGGGRCLLSAESGLLVAQVPRRGVVREVLLVEGNSKEHHERGGGAQEPEPEGLVFLTCLIWPVRPMTNSGMQRRQMKKPTTETPVFCGAVIMAMERPAKPRAQLRDTQLIGLRSWIASPSKK